MKILCLSLYFLDNILRVQLRLFVAKFEFCQLFEKLNKIFEIIIESQYSDICLIINIDLRLMEIIGDLKSLLLSKVPRKLSTNYH